MMNEIVISKRKIGVKYPTYIIAEMSANHNQEFGQAVRIIRAAKDAGAEAVKLQTYTADTMTIDCNSKCFQIKDTLWDGRRLYELYGEAYTPWDWQPKLKEIAEDFGLDLFSTPFDHSAVDVLERMKVPVYKIASFELVDLPLIRRIAQTGRPIIISTGAATLAEIDEAVQTIREIGGNQIALLKCTSAYPAQPEEMNLRTIPHMAETFKVPVGLSDHTTDIAVPVAAVTLGACIMEKHFTLSRSIPGPDSAFSMEPHEFKAMVEAIRAAEKALGEVHYGPTKEEVKTRVYRRSLFVVKDMKAGETFTAENVRSIRPGHGLHTRYLDEVIGRVARCDIQRGSPVTWDFVAGSRINR
jgi:pseudaminic acid synthase